MTFRNASRFRAVLTGPEQKLWSVPRDRRLSGYRFRRQHPIGPYVADFACVTHRLVVELDGSQHADLKVSHDAKRDAFLREQGYTVLRFWNPDILRNRRGVLETIYEALAARPSPASLREAPSPHVGRG